MYALLCRKLCEEAPNFEAPPNNSGNNNTNTFRRLLLAKCQDEFENRRRASEAFEQGGRVLSAEEEEARGLAKGKMLGNIKLIGELGKQGLLQEAILHQCVHQLLVRPRGALALPPLHTARDLECLCQIMKTVGHRLDNDKAKHLMNQYFDRIQVYASDSELPSRIRFMLQDVIELRQNRWIPRRILSEHGPKTIAQVRDDAARDLGAYHPGMRHNQHSSMLSKLQQRSGMDDVFSSLPIGSLGTGPGVISTDTFPSYSSNMGRPARGGLGGSGFLGGGSSQPYFNSNRNKNFSNRDHDLFPAYQQQRQQNQGQNQGFNNSTSSSRDLPPRFLKKGLQPHTGASEEISLRPAQNSMMTKSKIHSNKNNNTSMSSMNNSNSILRENSSVIPSVPINPVLQKEPPLIVKQVTQDKNKANKQVPSKEEVMKKSEELFVEYLKNQNLDTAVKLFKEMRMPKKYGSDVLLMMMKQTIDKSESERELLSQFFSELKKEGCINGIQVMEALKSIFLQMSELEAEVPRVKSHVAGFAAGTVSGELVTLSQLSEPLDAGQHYPLFLLCLQQLHKSQGSTWLQIAFAQSKLNLLAMLPEIDRTKERLADILEDRGLSFLFPLLRIQADLWKQLQHDPSPTSLYRWIKDTVDSSQHTVPGFVSALVSCMIKYITQETTLADGMDKSNVPDKIILDKEREMLDKFKPVFQAFLHEHSELQLVALYALQVHCYNCGFPKGMLLRWFMMFYDQEIIEEEAFLKWKEDVNDEYLGKGKALFQVNQWLTWLEEAEEEGSDDGEN